LVTEKVSNLTPLIGNPLDITLSNSNLTPLTSGELPIRKSFLNQVTRPIVNTSGEMLIITENTSKEEELKEKIKSKKFKFKLATKSFLDQSATVPQNFHSTFESMDVDSILLILNFKKGEEFKDELMGFKSSIFSIWMFYKPVYKLIKKKLYLHFGTMKEIEFFISIRNFPKEVEKKLMEEIIFEYMESWKSIKESKYIKFEDSSVYSNVTNLGNVKVRGEIFISILRDIFNRFYEEEDLWEERKWMHPIDQKEIDLDEQEENFYLEFIWFKHGMKEKDVSIVDSFSIFFDLDQWTLNVDLALELQPQTQYFVMDKAKASKVFPNYFQSYFYSIFGSEQLIDIHVNLKNHLKVFTVGKEKYFVNFLKLYNPGKNSFITGNNKKISLLDLKFSKNWNSLFQEMYNWSVNFDDLFDIDSGNYHSYRLEMSFEFTKETFYESWKSDIYQILKYYFVKNVQDTLVSIDPVACFQEFWMKKVILFQDVEFIERRIAIQAAFLYFLSGNSIYRDLFHNINQEKEVLRYICSRQKIFRRILNLEIITNEVFEDLLEKFDHIPHEVEKEVSILWIEEFEKLLMKYKWFREQKEVIKTKHKPRAVYSIVIFENFFKDLKSFCDFGNLQNIVEDLRFDKVKFFRKLKSLFQTKEYVFLPKSMKSAKLTSKWIEISYLENYSNEKILELFE
jgi:hypothetical protein